jgi:hypothetical protein
MLMAQACSDDSPARRSPALSSGRSSLDLESRSWPIGMGRWTDPALTAHHPFVKPNALGLKLSAQGALPPARRSPQEVGSFNEQVWGFSPEPR